MKSEFLQATEDLGARGATHPRVTLTDIENSIGAVIYTTADQLVDMEDQLAASYAEPLKILTICIIVMSNGFSVIGKSAPASPENFNPEKGRQFAYENAVQQIWPLMGFALRDRLYRDKVDSEHFDRVTAGDTTSASEAHGLANADLVSGENGDAGKASAQQEDTQSSVIPDDETLEGMLDQPVKDLALAHGIEFADRRDAIDKLKIKRHAISGQPNPV